jgi:hypothetical protein
VLKENVRSSSAAQKSGLIENRPQKQRAAKKKDGEINSPLQEQGWPG